MTTATGSEYLVNLPARTVKRRMATAAPLYDFLEATFWQLRRDGDTLELLLLKTWAVGISALRWVVIRDDRMSTLRRTSPVVKIKPREEPEG
ncbi:hypothetical protein D9M72_534730 [compost metagenome]